MRPLLFYTACCMSSGRTCDGGERLVCALAMPVSADFERKHQRKGIIVSSQMAYNVSSVCLDFATLKMIIK